MRKQAKNMASVGPSGGVGRPGGPGIVLEHQREAMTHLARRFSQIMHCAVAEAVPDDFLRNEFGILVAISRMPEIDRKGLADLMAMDPTSVGQLIDSLESRDFVERIGSPTDRRIKYLRLTPLGRKFLGDYRPRSLRAQSEALTPLSANERRTLAELLVRIIEANPDWDRPGGGRRSPKAKGD
jgi:MarR family transcriptional regulator, lower aerobic nicotinate degradation pathway regulator